MLISPITSLVCKNEKTVLVVRYHPMFIFRLLTLFVAFFLRIDSICFLCATLTNHEYIISRMRIKMVANAVGTAQAQLQRFTKCQRLGHNQVTKERRRWLGSDLQVPYPVMNIREALFCKILSKEPGDECQR